jgi:hypothetical protein
MAEITREERHISEGLSFWAREDTGGKPIEKSIGLFIMAGQSGISI